MLKNAPTLLELEEEIVGALRNKHLVVYNLAFDERFLTKRIIKAPKVKTCCMLKFARYYGLKNREPEPHQWQRLKFACELVNFKWPGKQHRALADALACRAVWNFLDSQDLK